MKWRLLSMALVIAFLIVGCGQQVSEEPTPTPIPTSMVPDKPTYVVSRGTVENKEQFTARVSPLNEEGLYFKRSGYVKVVYVDRGDWVEEGTVLAELEIEDLENQLALAEVDLERALKQYTLAEETHERELFSARMNLDVTKLQLDRALALPPVSDFTSLELAVERATEALEDARIAYSEALDRPWEPQRIRDALVKNITAAERSLKEAQANYDQAVLQARRAEKTYEIDVELLRKEVERAQQQVEWLERGVDPSLQQQVESAQLTVDRLKAQVDTARLVAPFPGEVTTLNVIPGKAIEARKAVAVIADPNAFDITADLTSNQMSLMEESQTAEVSFSSAPGQVFPAIIRQLPYPYGTGGGEIKVEDRDERTHIELLDPDSADLEVGDLVRVTVLIEQSLDVLYLPPAAIRTFEGRKFVMVRVGDRLQKVDVKLGVEGEDRVEILEGLEEGQVIEGL